MVSVSTTAYNSVANYTCNSSYALMGDAMRTCLETGSWSGDEPTCSSELQHVRNPLHIYTLACVLVSIAFNKSA